MGISLDFFKSFYSKKHFYKINLILSCPFDLKYVFISRGKIVMTDINTAMRIVQRCSAKFSYRSREFNLMSTEGKKHHQSLTINKCFSHLYIFNKIAIIFKLKLLE